MLLIFLTVLATIGTLVGGFGSFFYWRLSRSDITKKKDNDRITHALHPYDLRIHDLEISAAHAPDAIGAAITRALQPLLTSMTSLETKMEIVWEGQKQIALDAATVLHHPEPERFELDRLLDAFKDDTLTTEEEVQLRKYLVTIRNWERGQDVGFPVYEGEQMTAAILLRLMSSVITPRRKKDGKRD